MRTCENCGVDKQCYYRGIINPCTDWRINRKIHALRRKAQELVGKRMTFIEGQFVESATTLETFTPKQSSWLRSIYARIGK